MRYNIYEYFKYFLNLIYLLLFLFIFQAKKYSTDNRKFLVLYGISQNPNTNDYILVQKNFTRINGNEKIDDLIQEKQSKVKGHKDIVFEWIPYNQFNEINKTGRSDLITVYSAIWKNGPLYYNYKIDEYTRDSNKEVSLKYLHNSENPIEFVVNEV
jgi:hypothetical protein